MDAFSSSRASTPSTATGARSSTRCTTSVAFSLTTGTTLLTPSAAALPSGGVHRVGHRAAGGLDAAANLGSARQPPRGSP